MADVSVLDLLLDRNDSLINLDIKSEPMSRTDLDLAMKDEELEWPDPGDDFLNSILQGERLDSTTLLDPLEGMFDEDPIYDLCHTSSAASDSSFTSEVSLEQQLSPVPAGLSPLPQSSDAASDSDSSATMDCANLGEVQIQDNQAVINMKVTATTQQRIQRVIRMTPLKTTNVDGKPGRSILLPMSSLKTANGMRTIRIINTTHGGNLPAGLRLVCKPQSPAAVQTPTLSSTTETHTETVSDTGSDDSDGLHYPRLELSNEEKRLLKKEGITLPTHYPLTKMEERELKRIRRKIRNKISAQDSRKRKKEYVDGLEDRVRRCTDENVNLQKRVKALQSQNSSLVSQVKRLQAMLTQGPATRQVQPATCLMVLLLSLALVVVPNMRPGQQLTSNPVEDSTDINLPTEKPTPVAGRSRTLLYKYPVCNDELPFNVEGEEVVEELCSLQDHDYEPPSKVARHNKLPVSLRPIEYMDVDDVWPPPKAPPDVTQHYAITSSLDGSWSANEVDFANKLDAVLEEQMKPNSTSDYPETRSVLLTMNTEK
ncbi:hypothetical protein B566_EDAN000700 [Ephemera danica]|nr:hypothetical protein B566_EDAN000700 [Ephemera danica]